MTAFGDAPFDSELVAALSAAFPAPSPIQAAAWPVALAGDDLIAVAKTGSGKTLGFLLPAFHAFRTNDDRGDGKGKGTAVRALVLAPTRELALQISGECDKFSGFVRGGCPSLCVYGGAPIAAQQKALANKQAGLPVVVIATPGRLCDLLTRKSVDLSSVRYVVLDEVSHLVG